MPAPLQAGLPPYFSLDNNYIVRVTARNPTNGAVVSAVIASNVSISADDASGATASGSAPVPLLVPGP